MPKKTKLTTKQAKFVKGVVEGKPNYKAAMDAYDTTSLNVANTIAVENMQKPTIQQAIQESMKRQGIDVDSVVKPIADGLIANRIHITESGVQHTPDHGVRLKASGMALELMGAKKQGDTTVHINFNQHVEEQRAKYDL